MSKSVLSGSASAWNLSLVSIVQTLEKAGASPELITQTITRLERGKERRRRGHRMRRTDRLLLGQHFRDAIRVDPALN